MDVHEHLGVLRRGLVFILLGVVLGMATGFVLGLLGLTLGALSPAIAGGVLGLAVGLLAAWLREALDTRVRGPRDIAAVARIPILGDIPADRAVTAAPLVAGSGEGAPIADAFSDLGAHVDHLRTRDGGNSFVVVAAGAGQGTTTITANLAIALAGTAPSIVVVDADLRSSALSRLFGIHDALGLTEVLAGRASLDAALQSSDDGRLTVLPAGARPSNPGQLLRAPGMRELVDELRRRFAVVLIDAPSISNVTDAAVLGALDSAPLLVLAEGTTTRLRLEGALSLLASAGSIPVGIVLNAIPRRLFGRGRARRSEPVATADTFSFAPGLVAREPSHLVDPAAPVAAAAQARTPHPRTSRRASSPVTSAPLPTSVDHSVSAAQDLDFAFAALPTATADEQRAGSLVPEIELSRPAAVERPVVVRPDPPRPVSRFAPDPSKFAPSVASAYASAPAPSVAPGRVREPAVTGTVVNTVSIRIQRDAHEAATIPPPIRHILPAPTSSTIPPTAREAARADTADTADLSPARERETVGVAGSLLGEIGGLQRLEVRTARQGAVSDSGPDPERRARESYEQRARDLERAAHDRLMREQQRLAVSIREQLAHDKRELESVLDNRLEDTVMIPMGLPPRRAADPRFSDPRDDDGETR